MAQITEAIETYMYTIAGLSRETQISYIDKLSMFTKFYAERDIHDLEQLTPEIFQQFTQHEIECYRDWRTDTKMAHWDRKISERHRMLGR